MTGYHYNLDLPEELSKILEEDFWMLEDVDPSMFKSLTEPVKFEASTWIVVQRGSAKGEINLTPHDIKAPSLVIVRGTQFLQPTYISPDFKATVIVMSKRFRENVFLFMNSTPLYSLSMRHSVVPIPEETFPEYLKFSKEIRRILQMRDNPYASQALLFKVVSFIFETAYKSYEPYHNEILSRQGRISDKFLTLVQENFRSERFLDFYAQKIEVTPKHLSRTVKAQTGYTAVEWIERFVILEAKVLLKSSNLNIQQIADELNFPSQSFFGKYFKKFTGMSPKEFRNA